MVGPLNPSYFDFLLKPDFSAAHDRCADLLEVDTENRERRIQLKREKQRIQEAQSWLESLCRDDPNLLADPPFSE